MAVFYKLFQDNRKDSKKKGQWYARAKMLDTIKLDEIAQRIQDNTTAKKADAMAVLTEMVEVVRDYLRQSYAVRIDGLGTFKIGLSTSAATTIKDFSVSKNVKGMRVNFQPITKVDKNGKRINSLTYGSTVKELPKNGIAAEEEEDVNP